MLVSGCPNKKAIGQASKTMANMCVLDHGDSIPYVGILHHNTMIHSTYYDYNNECNIFAI